VDQMRKNKNKKHSTVVLLLVPRDDELAMFKFLSFFFSQQKKMITFVCVFLSFTGSHVYVLMLRVSDCGAND